MLIIKLIKREKYLKYLKTSILSMLEQGITLITVIITFTRVTTKKYDSVKLVNYI